MSQPLRFLPFLALASLLVLPVTARAETPVLLRDIADDPQANASSDLRQLTPFKNQVAFVTDVADRFDSLWVSDGTGPGTRTVFQRCFGNFCNGALRILGTAGGRLFFYAQSDEEDIRRLWSTDGTRARTLPLTKGDLASPGVVLSGGQIALSDRFAYFLGCGDACGVWRSDGTPAGTVLWKPYDGPGELGDLMLAGDRLYSVASEFGSNSRLWAADTRTGDAAVVASWETFGAATALTAAAGKLFFFAPDTEGTSVELWVSDGTAGGTRALTRFEASNPFQDTEWMKEIGGRVYFVANDVVHGFELWRSDGTPQGTVRVSDFGYLEALSGLSPDGLAQAGGKILFVARDGLTDARLWISDGRPESTAPFFRNFCPEGGCDVQADRPFLVQIGGKAFFPGENGLWSTDGTRAGTRRFSDPLCTNECFQEIVFQALQGKIVFTARDDAHGVELWTSDGTRAGTRRLTDIPDLGPFDRPFGPIAAAGRWIFFRGHDSHGDEPWVTDGQETRLVADLGRSAPGSDPREPTPVGDRLFFTACQGGQRAVWVSGGTPETTAQVPDTAASCPSDFLAPTDLTAASGRLFFHRRDPHISQLWSTDGGAPVQISHLTSANDSIASHAAIEFQGRLLVPIRTAGQLALWQSSAAGDGLVKKVDLPDLSSIDQMWAVGGEVFLRGSASDVALWRTDGTQAGTRQLADETNPTSDFLRLGSSVLFIALSRDDDGFIESGLWKTDGTAAGTVPVRVPLRNLELPYKLVAFQGKVYFFVQDGDDNWSLWRSDGTAAGTVPVRQLANGDSFSRFELTVAAGKLFFAADDGVHGRELWTSDGTADGTRMVLDLNPGKAAGAPDLYFTLTAAGGKLYFAGNDGVHGVELWESDGTAAGTRLVQDLAPEAASSLPEELTPAGDHLFFVADDLLTGREPWALPLSGPAGCQPSSTRLCLNGGRYQVEASWLTGDQSGRGTAVSLSTDTGYFWFFNQENVELVVKILDGQGVNGHVWVFYGALSNVEYSITVSDTQTGLTRRYFNPQGTLASVGDTHGFGPLGASSANPEPPVSRAAASPLPLVSARTDPAAVGSCQASARRLCLNGNRFAVEVAWKDFDNHTGTGTAAPLTTDTGTFWFFNAANVELVVKILDGRPVNNKFWLFYGALSNVEYTVTVTDTETGAVRTYRNPKGRFASVADTTAF